LLRGSANVEPIKLGKQVVAFSRKGMCACSEKAQLLGGLYLFVLARSSIMLSGNHLTA